GSRRHNRISKETEWCLGRRAPCRAQKSQTRKPVPDRKRADRRERNLQDGPSRRRQRGVRKSRLPPTGSGRELTGARNATGSAFKGCNDSRLCLGKDRRDV